MELVSKSKKLRRRKMREVSYWKSRRLKAKILTLMMVIITESCLLSTA
jgi:hypothetical protein